MPLIVWAYLGYIGGLLAGFSQSWILMSIAISGVAAVAIWHRSSEAFGAWLLVVAGTVLASSVSATTMQHQYTSPAPDTTTFFGRQRLRAEQAIDDVFHEDAPLAEALLVADKTRLSRDVKQQYVAAGIAHRLSISGLHVAIIAAAIELLCRLFRMTRRTAIILSIVTIAGYVALIGFPLPALRAGMMFGIVKLSRLLQRPTSPWAILAGCGFVPLIDPSVILTVGYQLNMAGVASFMAGIALSRRILGKKAGRSQKRFARWKGPLIQSILIPLVATAITGPLIAWWFGQVSLVAPITNVVVEPVFAMLQPLLFLGVLFAPWHTLASIFADAAHPLFAAINMIAVTMTSIPYASVTVKPAVSEAILAGISSAASFVACLHRSPIPPILLAGTAMCALLLVC